VGCSGTLDQCNDTAEANPHPTGGSGIILHYTVTGGVGTWGIFPSPATPPLNSIFMVSTDEGWAVGDGTSSASATVLHYTVTGGLGTWNALSTSAQLPAGSNLNSVFMLSPTSGWAVGGVTQPACAAFTQPGECSSTFFEAGPVIIYWDGTKWSRVLAPELPGGGKPVLLSTYFTGPSDGWAVGTPGVLVPTILHWDGVRWMSVTLAPALLGVAPPTIPPTLKSVYMTDPGNGWIVGSPVNFNQTFIGPSNTGTKPLASIFRFAPFGGVLSATSTTTIVSTIVQNATTVTTSVTSFVTVSQSTLTSTSTSTGVTVVPPPIPGMSSLVWWIVGIVVVVAVVLVLLLLLLWRRRPRPPVVLYPIVRRPY